MLRSYRHIGLALILVLIFSSTALGVQSKPLHNPPSDEQQSSKSERLSPTIINQQITTGDNRAPNDQPKTGKNSQFDLDRRSVEAAEKSARWAEYSVYAGATGIAFVILTFAANAYATFLMRRDFLSKNRPKIRLNTCAFDVFAGDVPLVLNLTQINIGDHEARIFNHSFSMVYRHGSAQQDLGPANIADDSPPLEPGFQAEYDIATGFILDDQQVALVRSGEADLFLDVTTHFYDGNGTRRFTDVIRQYHRQRRRFLKVNQDHEYARDDFEG